MLPEYCGYAYVFVLLLYPFFLSKWHPEHNYQGWVNTMHVGKIEKVLVRDDEYLK